MGGVSWRQFEPFPPSLELLSGITWLALAWTAPGAPPATVPTESEVAEREASELEAEAVEAAQGKHYLDEEPEESGSGEGAGAGAGKEEVEQEFVDRYEVQMNEGGRLGDDAALSAEPPKWRRLDKAVTGGPAFIPGGLESQVSATHV